MIKINLSPLLRPKTSNQGMRMVVLALIVWGGAALVIGLAVHWPMTEQIDQLQRSVSTLQAENSDKTNELRGYEELKKTIADAEARAKVVNRLNLARAVPAHMLFELSRVLTPNALPTMTDEVRQQIEGGRTRELVREWDPSNMWLTSFTALVTVRTHRYLKDKPSVDTRYFIASFAGTAAQLLDGVRTHWSIENSHHWVLDIAFREDDNRVRDTNAASNLSILRRFALSLCKQEKTAKVGIKIKLFFYSVLAKTAFCGL